MASYATQNEHCHLHWHLFGWEKKHYSGILIDGKNMKSVEHLLREAAYGKANKCTGN